MKPDEARTLQDTEDPVAKSAPPLRLRASAPRAIRLRKPVIQGVVASAAILLSGALVWAFFIQPGLRDADRVRQAEAGQPEAQGVVRPSEAVTDQPATYDRLPPPRQAAGQGDAVSASPSDEAIPGPAGPSPPGHLPIRPGGQGAGYRGDGYPGAGNPVRGAYGPQPSAEGPGALAIRSAIFFETPDRPRSAPPSAGGEEDHSRVRGPQARETGGLNSPNGLTAPLSPYELQAGAVVPAALLTAMDTSRSGPVVAVVTQNIYDTVTGTHLLLPQGSRLIGTSGGDTAHGENRAFVVWDRLILPNGKSLLLAGEPGVDAQGSVGVRGQVDRRIGPLLVGTLFAGAITTLGQMAREGQSGAGSGFVQDAGDAAAIEASRVGGRLVDRELQVRPSVRLQAGSRVAVLITRDLVLERYVP